MICEPLCETANYGAPLGKVLTNILFMRGQVYVKALLSLTVGHKDL